MEIRNNLLRELKDHYINMLTEQYGEIEAKSLVSILIEDFFGYNQIDLSLNPDIRLSESEILKLHKGFKQLKDNKPVQYITGYSDFMDFRFRVTPNVLIPRQETEELVDLIKKKEDLSEMRVLDIGTGSGCIAISLFHYLKNPVIHAIDVDTNVLDVATENAASLNSEIVFHRVDILKTKEPITDGQFDIIVSNPPYVTESDKQQMQNNVLDYEPSLALFVTDDDPLRFYTAILRFAENNLKGNGRVYFEINESLGDDMIELLKDSGYLNVDLHMDLHKKPRFISAVKPS